MGMTAGDPTSLARLLDVLEEAVTGLAGAAAPDACSPSPESVAAPGPAPTTAVVREFLAGPPVVRVTGPKHGERATVARWLEEQVPSARVLDAELAPPDPNLLWDVSVVVTPADRMLSLPEKNFIEAAAAARRPVMVLVSRLAVFGDADDQAEARRELDSLSLTPFLRPRGVRWAYFPQSPQDYDPAVARQVAMMAAGEGGHDRAVRAYLRREADALIGTATGLLAERRTRQDAIMALRARVTGQRASLIEGARTRVLAALDRLRAAQARVYQSVDALVDMARAWLDSGGLVPWADVEHPVRGAIAQLAADTGRLGPDFEAAIRGDLGRLGDILEKNLGHPGLGPAVVSEVGVPWQEPAMDAALAMVSGASLDPVLSAAEKLMQDYLDTLSKFGEGGDSGRDDQPDDGSDNGSADDTPDGSGDDVSDKDTSRWGYVTGALSAIGRTIADAADPLPTAPSYADTVYEQVHGTVLQFLDAYLRPRVREAAAQVEDTLTRAGRAAVDDALAAAGRALDNAEADLAGRYPWADAYARLIALRDEIG
jgi:hypothetical protein